MNDLCKEAPETVPHDPEANPRKECFTKGKRICLENYFSGRKIKWLHNTHIFVVVL